MVWWGALVYVGSDAAQKFLGKAEETYSARVQKNASGCHRGLLLAIRKRYKTLSTRACCLGKTATTLVARLLSCKPQNQAHAVLRGQCVRLRY